MASAVAGQTAEAELRRTCTFHGRDDADALVAEAQEIARTGPLSLTQVLHGIAARVIRQETGR